jgi:NAD(P)H-dependent FMN reductase
MDKAMQPRSYLLMDGTLSDDHDLTSILDVLRSTLNANGNQVQTLAMCSLKLGHCVGCFGCWLKTPGQCIQRDSGGEIVQAILRSDTTVLFSPVMFGGYSPELKRMLDRCLSSLNLPYLQVSHNETHHEPRYERYPRLVGVGVQRQPHPGEAELFKLVVGRNALQFHAPSHAASVITATDSAETLQREFQALLTRDDPLPAPKNLKNLLSDQEPAAIHLASPPLEQHALLLVGSPKARSSTSAALGGYLMQQLERRGWHTETLKIRARLRDPEAQHELLSAIERAALVVLAFPLYNDSLPYLVSYALQLIMASRSIRVNVKTQRLVAIVNNGFPEPHHTLPALAHCHYFAKRCGMHWAGGMAVGGGEALSAGQPLPEIKRILPPVKHLMRALELAAEGLAKGQGIPVEASRLIARNPIYPAPFLSYRWIFQRVAAKRWEREASENGVSTVMLRAQPYQPR